MHVEKAPEQESPEKPVGKFFQHGQLHYRKMKTQIGWVAKKSRPWSCKFSGSTFSEQKREKVCPSCQFFQKKTRNVSSLLESNKTFFFSTPRQSYQVYLRQTLNQNVLTYTHSPEAKKTGWRSPTCIIGPSGWSLLCGVRTRVVRSHEIMDDDGIQMSP